VIPLGPVKLVAAITDAGMVACGAFDVKALDGLGIPAARVAAAAGGLLSNIDDLLKGTVREVNRAAAARGVGEGMSGLDALDCL